MGALKLRSQLCEVRLWPNSDAYWQISCSWLTCGSDEGWSLLRTLQQLLSQLVSYLQLSESFLLLADARLCLSL